VELQEKVEAGMLKGDAYEDSEEEFLRFFPELIELCYSKMRDDGHLYCFFAMRHKKFVWDTFFDAGFHGIDRPIIVYKEGRGSGRQGDHWPVSSYESMAIFKKGRRAMNYGGISDLQVVPWIAPTAKRGHPSAKPSEIYSRILKWSARPGDTVCDPTYGSGAAFLACEQNADLKLNWFGWEKDPSARRIALMNLTEFQVELFNTSKTQSPSILSKPEHIEGKANLERDIEAIPTTFIGIEPMTEMWKRYWAENPGEQVEMLAYRKLYRETKEAQA
jgi:DNA modification methylase